MNTTHWLNRVAGNVFGTQTIPALPTEYYIGLSTTAPDTEGNGVNEPASAAGYARVKLENLSAPVNGVVSNTTDINFPESSGDWGVVTHYVIFDAKNGGNLLIYGQFNNSRTVEPGTVVTIQKDKDGGLGMLRLSVVNPAS